MPLGKRMPGMPCRISATLSRVSDGADRQRNVSLRLRYKRLSGQTRRLLATEGESGRFEFKQNDAAVSAGVRAAAANAAALEGLDAVTILVGVEEVEDPATGVVRGRVGSLDDVETARSRITSRAASIRPVPPHLTVFDENTAAMKPILRLAIRPTRAPHYTDTGNRATRYGASTRAITDEELKRAREFGMTTFTAFTRLVEAPVPEAEQILLDVLESSPRRSSTTACYPKRELGTSSPICSMRSFRSPPRNAPRCFSTPRRGFATPRRSTRRAARSQIRIGESFGRGRPR